MCRKNLYMTKLVIGINVKEPPPNSLSILSMSRSARHDSFIHQCRKKILQFGRRLFNIFLTSVFWLVVIIVTVKYSSSVATIIRKPVMDVENRFFAIKEHLDGPLSESIFELKTAPLSLAVEEGTVNTIVKNIYVSVDPYHVNRIKKYSSSQDTGGFATRQPIGEEISTFGVGRVVASGSDKFKCDDLVSGVLCWGDYTVVPPGALLNKIEASEFPLTYHMGVLGSSGLTAYGGLYGVCKPKKGEKVFVSAASGSVGNLVGQYAKLSGCYVVGCAGSNSKVDVLKEKLGFDDAFNYKDEPDLKSALKRYFPEGIDIYFDNVGAEMLEAAVANMNPFGRVAVCGVIAEYTDKDKRAAPDMLDIVYKRITIQGFLAFDFYDLHAEFISATSNHLRNGQMHVLEDISYGLESVPSAFVGLFRGDNVGKKFVKVGDE